MIAQRRRGTEGGLRNESGDWFRVLFFWMFDYHTDSQTGIPTSQGVGTLPRRRHELPDAANCSIPTPCEVGIPACESYGSQSSL